MSELEWVQWASKQAWVQWAAFFALWCWLVWRLDRLGKQIEAVADLVVFEMAEMLGNEKRVNELMKDRRREKEERKKHNRQGLIGAAIIFPIALALWWWFSFAGK